MTETVKNNVRWIYKILLSALTVALGIAFIVQILSIYNSAPKNPYTTEKIQVHFREITPLFWAWIALIVVGGVLFSVFPEQTDKPKAYIELQTVLCKIESRLPVTSDLS